MKRSNLILFYLFIVMAVIINAFAINGIHDKDKKCAEIEKSFMSNSVFDEKLNIEYSSFYKHDNNLKELKVNKKIRTIITILFVDAKKIL